jgi:hypothetical protein
MAPTSSCRIYFALPVMPEQYVNLPGVPNGYCPNHATGVTLPEGFTATPLQYVD